MSEPIEDASKSQPWAGQRGVALRIDAFHWLLGIWLSHHGLFSQACPSNNLLQVHQQLDE